MKIDIVRPTVILQIDKKKIEMTHNDLELLFEKLRVHLGKQQYYPYYTYYTSPNITWTSSCASGSLTGTSAVTNTMVSDGTVINLTEKKD